jgi:hypothetical protein
MPTLHRTRRWLVGALAGGIASAAFGTGHNTRAADDDPRPRPDYASKEAFRLECILLGGIFTETGGYTYCHHASGTVVCDDNGKNCTSHPTSWSPQPGGANAYDGSVDQVATRTDQHQDDHPRMRKRVKKGTSRRHRSRQ